MRAARSCQTDSRPLQELNHSRRPFGLGGGPVVEGSRVHSHISQVKVPSSLRYVHESQIQASTAQVYGGCQPIRPA